MDWRSTSSAFATVMFLKTIPDLLPPQIKVAIQTYLHDLFQSLNLDGFLRSIKPTITISIEETDPSGYSSDIYGLVQAYLSSKSLAAGHSITMYMSKNSNNTTYKLNVNESIQETFDGVEVTWSYHSNSNPEAHGRSKTTRSFNLSFHRKHRDKIHSAYLPHVFAEAAVIRFKNRERKLFTNRPMEGGGGGGNNSLWTYVRFSHPATFDTLAMDPDLKEEIKNDLLKFLGRKEYYTCVGRAWKRGYLLYGPPGTGQTSMIAAIANFLDFDIYDLELTAVKDNSHLRRLLVSTSTKSVIVVEDIDCTVDLSMRGTKRARDGTEVTETTQSISLSGVLNFIDGLWSSCSGERIMVFTTNHKDHLDPALLRPGRMDKQIHMGYCGFAAFKLLAKNYLGIDEHELMKEVEETLPTVQMTPADVAEVLMGCEDDPDQGMISVVESLKKRRRVETLALAATSQEEMEKEVVMKTCSEFGDKKEDEEVEGEGIKLGEQNCLKDDGNMKETKDGGAESEEIDVGEE